MHGQREEGTAYAPLLAGASLSSNMRSLPVTALQTEAVRVSGHAAVPHVRGQLSVSSNMYALLNASVLSGEHHASNSESDSEEEFLGTINALLLG
jgi:hypothetical protein